MKVVAFSIIYLIITSEFWREDGHLPPENGRFRHPVVGRVAGSVVVGPLPHLLHQLDERARDLRLLGGGRELA